LSGVVALFAVLEDELVRVRVGGAAARLAAMRITTVDVERVRMGDSMTVPFAVT